MPGNSAQRFAVDGAALGVQVAYHRVGVHHAVAQNLERLLPPAALEVMPECGQSLQLALRRSQSLALRVGFGLRRLQPPIDVREAGVLGRFALRLELGGFADLGSVRQIRGEAGQLLMAALPQSTQLVEHQCAEPAAKIRKQVAQPIQLLLHANGGAFLLFEAVAQQVKFVLKVRVRLFQARAILEELHQPLFVGTRAADFQSVLEKTQLIDQGPASNRSLLAGHQWGYRPARNRWPRSAQYSSHLFNIMFRVQR